MVGSLPVIVTKYVCRAALEHLARVRNLRLTPLPGQGLSSSAPPSPSPSGHLHLGAAAFNSDTPHQNRTSSDIASSRNLAFSQIPAEPEGTQASSQFHSGQSPSSSQVSILLRPMALTSPRISVVQECRGSTWPMTLSWKEVCSSDPAVGDSAVAIRILSLFGRQVRRLWWLCVNSIW